VRYKLNQLFFLEKCLTSVNSFDERYDHYLLKPKDSVKYDVNVENSFSVLDLRLTLDPRSDYGMITHLGNELDEFIEMYYSPCIAELFGTNEGTTPDVEPQYFMAYSWLTHDACSKLSCLADNMRWDRKDDSLGCVPSLIIADETLYDTSNPNSNCAKNNNVNTFAADTEVCKYEEETLFDYQDSAKACWGDTVPDYLMNHFCMPQLSGRLATEDDITRINEKYQVCTASIAATPATVSRRRMSGDNNNLKPRQLSENLQETLLKTSFAENAENED